MTRPLWLAALALAACQCAPPSGGDGGPCTFEIKWGHAPNCTFTAFADHDEAELTLGFQGFRFIDSAVRVVKAPSPDVKLTFELAIEGQAPTTQPAGVRTLQSGPDGALYANQVLVFVNEIPLVELLGRRADVGVAATSQTCRADARVNVTLVDRDPGIQGLDAGYECPGG